MPADRAKPERAAAGEQHRVRRSDDRAGAQRIGAERPGRAAAHVHAADRAGRGEHDRAAGTADRVAPMADRDALRELAPPVAAAPLVAASSALTASPRAAGPPGPEPEGHLKRARSRSRTMAIVEAGADPLGIGGSR